MKKIALVTGSSRGIGLAAAKELESAGCQVIYHASKVSDKLLAAAGTSPFYGVDLSSAEATADFADELIAGNQVPDILVFNASYQSYTGIGNFTAEIDQKTHRFVFTIFIGFQCFMGCGNGVQLDSGSKFNHFPGGNKFKFSGFLREKFLYLSPAIPRTEKAAGWIIFHHRNDRFRVKVIGVAMGDKIKIHLQL